MVLLFTNRMIINVIKFNPLLEPINIERKSYRDS